MKQFAFLGLLVALFLGFMTTPVLAEEMATQAEVDQLLHDVRSKYDWDKPAYPYLLVEDVLRKVNYVNINRHLQRWQSLSGTVRAQVLSVFQDAGLDRFMFLMFAESGCKPDQVSWAGAIGLFQIMPRTAKAICDIEESDLYDPVQNAKCAVQVLERYGIHDNWKWALAQYQGIIRSCPSRGYTQCLHRKFKAGNQKVKGPLYYQATFLVYMEIGKRFIHDWTVKPSRVAKK